jgi:hypothetical protein
MKNVFTILLLIGIICINSCQLPQNQRRYNNQAEDIKIDVTNSVAIPSDGSAPVAGLRQSSKADRTLTFNKVGDKFEVKQGEEVNIIYDGVDPDRTYITYESTYDGFTLELTNRDQTVSVEFNTLCQTYVVANPMLTNVSISDNLKYEQIIWTPRADGTWEVRVGTVERGCKSKALDNLQKLRSKDYEKSVPKYKK